MVILNRMNCGKQRLTAVGKVSRDLSSPEDYFMLVGRFVIQTCPTYAADNPILVGNPARAGAAP